MNAQSFRGKSGDQPTVDTKPIAGKGNKQIVKALVIGPDEIDVRKQELPQSRGTSKAKPQEDYWQKYKDQYIEPPISPEFLATIEEYSTILQQCIEAMEVNIEGFGARLVPLKSVDQLEEDEAKLFEVNEERRKLTNFLVNATGEDSLVSLRRKLRHDLESTGNSFMELVRHPFTNKPDKLVHVPSYQVRLGLLDKEHTEYTVYRQIENAPGEYTVQKVKDYKRFRRYLQLQYGLAGGPGVVWFKEYGDPRIIDCRTGEVVEGEDLNGFDVARYGANEMIYNRIYSSRSPYGLPRYKGCLITLLGDREAEEVNYTTLKNNNIPSMIVAVSNGMMTQESIDRMKDFAKEHIQGSHNYSKFLILEAEGIFEGTDPGQIRLDIKPLQPYQMKDQLFQEYGQANREKIRQSFRLPPIFIGITDDYTRATAEASRRLADEQIFNPERDEADHMWNKLLYEFNMIHHKFKTNGPNITDDEDLLKLLVAAEKTGAMTPRIGTEIITDILGRPRVEKWPEGVNPDIPFSLQMAEAVKNKASPVEPGQQVTAIKSNSSPEPVDAISALMIFRDQMISELHKRAVGD